MQGWQVPSASLLPSSLHRLLPPLKHMYTWNILISFESCTESESKLVIKHLLKCFFLSLLSRQHETSLHNNALCTSACVVVCPAQPQEPRSTISSLFCLRNTIETRHIIQINSSHSLGYRMQTSAFMFLQAVKDSLPVMFLIRVQKVLRVSVSNQCVCWNLGYLLMVHSTQR